MNCKLAISGLLCAALLSGCSSAPTLAEASGPWTDLNGPTRAQGTKAAVVGGQHEPAKK